MATYKMIGHDQRQYASVTEEQLRQWIREGRADAQTRVQAEGSTEWRALGELPEFQAALTGSSPPRWAPAMSSGAPPKTSGMAIASLVLGILGVFTCGVSAVAGLILGIVAMVKVKNSQGALKGSGLALAGIILSGISLLMLLLILPAMMLPALAQAKQKAQEINCMNNEKQLALAVIIYSSDNTNHLPSAASWCDAIQSAAGTDRIFKCPAALSASRCDYAFNAKLGGMDQKDINPQTVMIFEANGGWNANGGRELLPAKARHGRSGIYVVAFTDGHVEAVNQSRLNALRWDP